MAASGTTSDDMPGEARVNPDSGHGPEAAGAEQPTRPLVSAGGDRCAACGAPLASDQRYCLACGERRGKTRFPLAASASPAAAGPESAAGGHRRPHVSSAAALIAGIGTLLLALGVGVLIGRTNTNNPTPVAATRNSPVVVTVPGSSGGGSGPARSSHSASTAKAGPKKTAAAKPKQVVVTKQVAAKASAAASKVLGGNINTPATVSVGQKGSGPGFSNGRFTGTFFGH